MNEISCVDAARPLSISIPLEEEIRTELAVVPFDERLATHEGQRRWSPRDREYSPPHNGIVRNHHYYSSM